MDPYLRILRPLLFRIDPEKAHNAALWAIAKGLIRGKMLPDPRLQVHAHNLLFPNPLGLAAGVDKNGMASHRWANMGFGFAEIGTVTAHPQPGNPKPRLFRFPEHRAVLNRMGFNNLGAEHLKHAWKPSTIPLGINIGKSKITPLDQAPADYARSYDLLKHLADYVVINVSSPNTPGLRSLQETSALKEIVQAMRESPGTHPPLFLKLAPDGLDYEAMVELATQQKLAGLILTNTTLDQSFGEGGVSGKPLWEKSNAALKQVAGLAQGQLTLIGVGGIFTGQDLAHKLSLGATLAQTYTGWVYGGPLMPYRVLTEYLALDKDKPESPQASH